MSRFKGRCICLRIILTSWTPAEAAAALGISKGSVYKLLRSRQLGCRHIGRKIIIPKVCLVDFVQSARYTVSNP